MDKRAWVKDEQNFMAHSLYRYRECFQKPNEALDWIYAKLEYRNQGSFPFGVSVQYSNQILVGRAYIPVLGDWLYVEGRYSTPLRDPYPFEIENFFMVSPVFRLNF